MKKFIKNMNSILLYLWQLPQNLLGLLLLDLYDAKFVSRYRSSKTKTIVFVYLSKTIISSIALGKYIIFDPKHRDSKTIRHQCGYARLSEMFGWLYLLLIGIPSLLNAICAKLLHIEYFEKNYCNLYPEKWADKLGGVKRNEED